MPPALPQSPTQALLAAYVDGFLRQPPRLTAAVNAIKMACSAIFALVGGVVADRVGRRAALVIGLILAISGAFLLVAETPWHLLALAVIAGTSAGFVSTGGQSYLLAVSPAQRLGTATAAYFLGRTASQALGGVCGRPGGGVRRLSCRRLDVGRVAAGRGTRRAAVAAA